MALELDPKTIERVTRIICDIDGPFERRGWQLEALLRDAGWNDPPVYDGSSRVLWLTEAINSADQASVERLICRVCHPLEYDEDGIESAELVRQEINQVLALQGLTVSQVAGQPVMARLGGDGVVYTAPEELEPRLRAIIDDSATVDWLLERAEETRICEANGAYVFALIGMGSFVEYLLYTFLHQWDPDIKERGFTDPSGRRTTRPSLDHLIKTAHSKGYIQLDRRDFMDRVRDYRNFVHLRHQTEKDLRPDRHTIMMCWGPIRAVLTDLEAVASKSSPARDRECG
ncbi:hypothetical protein ABZ912_57410 [Nonomuraea angiospora]|jgi:hypothetical protein|uniref:hypothetical protein n=1 Tax=Nonomuraea angiospora TaxID=46172 RepID=UPI00340FFC6B